MPRPDRFTTGKEVPYPFYGRRGATQSQSVRVRRIRSYRDTIPGLSSPQRVAIQTDVPEYSIFLFFMIIKMRIVSKIY